MRVELQSHQQRNAQRHKVAGMPPKAIPLHRHTNGWQGRKGQSSQARQQHMAGRNQPSASASRELVLLGLLARVHHCTLRSQASGHGPTRKGGRALRNGRRGIARTTTHPHRLRSICRRNVDQKRSPNSLKVASGAQSRPRKTRQSRRSGRRSRAAQCAARRLAARWAGTKTRSMSC